MQESYHYIGLDIHKRTVTFCAKRADGETLDAGTFRASRESIAQWAAERPRPWIGGMEATLFTGFVYDVLTPYAMELQVGHPLQICFIVEVTSTHDDQNLQRGRIFTTGISAGQIPGVVAGVDQQRASLAERHPAAALGYPLLMLMPASHRRGGTEQLRILEHDAGRPPPPGREACHGSSRPFRHGAIVAVNVGDQFFYEGCPSQ